MMTIEELVGKHTQLLELIYDMQTEINRLSDRIDELEGSDDEDSE
jgi:hypothetical protein